MIITLGDIAIAIGIIGGLTLSVVGAFVAKDAPSEGRAAAVIGLVLLAVSLWGGALAGDLRLHRVPDRDPDPVAH